MRTSIICSFSPWPDTVSRGINISLWMPKPIVLHESRGWGGSTGVSIQSTLVISTSVISNNRLSR